MSGPWNDFADTEEKPQEAGPWQDYAPKGGASRSEGPWDDYAAAEKRPGFLSTIGQAATRGIKEGFTEASEVVDPFKPKPAHQDDSYLGKILEQPVSEGWKDPNWWAAHIAYGGAKSAPSLATGAAGALAGSTMGPVGTLAGSAGGFGLGSVIQTLAPAYQRARQEGLEHDEAVDRAMKQAGIAGAFGAAMGAAPAARLMKAPISEALAQIFAVQPALGAGQQVATAATEGRLPSGDELGTAYAENVGLGAVLTGAHAGARRLTAKNAPAIAAEEHPVPAGGVQTAPEGVPEPTVRNHQVGYDLETNTFKVIGPEGETIKTGFENDALAEKAAREMDHVAPIDAAANEAAEPTPAQAEAGNYRKGHLTLHDMDIAIETPKGAMRRGIGPGGEAWENESPAHYGYLKRTEGADGEHVDTYVGPHPESKRAFVVDQIDPETGKFDEHKAILGARTLEEARDIYDRGFSDGSGPERRAAIAEMPVTEFRRWLKEGDTKTDIAPQVGEGPRDWADIAVPLAAKESGLDLTPWQHHQALALVRNGMDSGEAVKRVTDIPFQPAEGDKGTGSERINSWLSADTKPPEAYTAKEAEAVRRVQAITERIFPGVETRIHERLYGGKPGEEQQEIYGAAYRTSANRLMALSLASPDMQQTAMHEGIHSLRQVGAITEPEWSTLTKAAEKNGWLEKHKIAERYGPDDGRHIEEAVAEEFSKSRSEKFKGLPDPIRAIFQKIDEYLRRIGAAARQIFGRNATPEDIFTRVETGEVGRRAPGEGPDGVAFARGPYRNAPDSLMGFRRNGPHKGYDEQRYPHEQWVRVTYPDGQTFVDAVKGMNEKHAVERAYRNWEGAEIEPLRKSDPAVAAEREATGDVDFQRLNPDAPRVAHEGRNPMDETSSAIAEAVGGKGAGTYDRAMDRLRPKAGSELKNLNPVENFTIFPDTLAKTDKMFARLWNAWKDRDREEHRHITGWRELIPELRNAKRGDPDVQKAYAAIEMHRINNEMARPGEPVRVRNVDRATATKSKPGDDYVLTPRQAKIYHELNALHSAEWDTLMAATAKKYGWKGDPTAAAVSAGARGATKSEARQLGRLAELLHMMAAQKQRVYFPSARFGDTFIAVKPKAGSEKDSLGGFPELQHFETVERPWSQDVLGKSGRPDVSKRVAELQKQYPDSEIETGLLQKRPDMLRRLDIPAVEKLLMLTENKVQRDAKAEMRRRGLTEEEAKADAASEHAKFKDEMLDTLRNVMYEEMKSGFKKKSRLIPGYSSDFDRAIGSHMHQMSRHAADLVHREGIDRAYQDIQDKHEHESTKKWVRDWRQFQDDPTTPLGRAANNIAQVGYVWTLGMNPSSTMVNLFDIPQSAIPSLGVGNGIRAAMAHMTPALAEAYRHAKFNLKQGAHIDLHKIGRTPEERALIKRLADDGSVHSVSVDDMRELGSRQAEAYGEVKSTIRRAMDIATSNMSVMDQANRAAVALSFYRMAQDPKALNKMAEAWGGNQKFRDMVEYNGLNPETMARFGLSEAAYEWGRANKSKIMRGPMGTMMFTLHGYQTRFLSNAFKLMRNMGPAGRIAAGWMMVGLWAGAGIEGLPFAQDMENLGDVVWKTLTKHDPMISYRLREALSNAGLGKVGAEIVMKGPLSTLTGTDVSNRIGFGDILSRQWTGLTSGTDVLGTVPSIMFSRLSAAWRREQSNQGHLTAAAELLPAALRNPARAAVEAEQGLKTQKGKTVTPARKISDADLVKVGLGLRPINQVRGYENREYSYRAKRAHGTVPRNAIPGDQ